MSSITINFIPARDRPIYLQLYQHIVQEIKQGTYRRGDRLPSKRMLAQHLAISLNTVDTAYQMLVTEGYVHAIPKSGFYVCAVEQLEAGAPPPMEVTEPSPAPRFDYDLSTGSVDPSVFPFVTWARITKDLMYHSPDLLHHGHRQGDLCLRETLCRYLHQFRGVICEPSQVIIGAGMEYLLTVVCRLLPGASFAMEDPAYPKARQIIESSGQKICPIPLDASGLRADLLDQSGADCVYLTPSHQFPTGVIMPVGRRTELLKWASAKENRYLIEDDYDSEFKYTGRPIPALQSLDINEKVIYCGTFSRSIAPSIRIGYLVLPHKLLSRYQKEFSLQSSTVSRFEQHTLTRFIEEGHLERHLNRTRTLYKKRRDLLLSCLKNSALAENLAWHGIDAGLHFTLQLQNGLSESQMVRRASQNGIHVVGLSGFYADADAAPASTILCGYAHCSPLQIENGCRALCEAWRND